MRLVRYFRWQAPREIGFHLQVECRPVRLRGRQAEQVRTSHPTPRPPNSANNRLPGVLSTAKIRVIAGLGWLNFLSVPIFADPTD